MTIEATGHADKLAALLRVLEPFGIRELVQSGMVAVGRGSPLDHRPVAPDGLTRTARLRPGSYRCPTVHVA